MNVTVLGCGMVGSAIAEDLSKKFKVLAADLNNNNLKKLSGKKNIKTLRTDLSKKNEIKKAVKNADIVVGAVPGFMGFETVRTVIEEKKNIVDISFFEEDPFELDELAKKNNVTAVVDCGVAPGLSNIILGYHNEKMKINLFECMVGGLPFKRTLPFQYKAPFSPIDVIEEYIRPARIVEQRKIITKPALSDKELIEIEPIGTLESFNTDGLRSLLRTMKIPNMKEKTLRYPGHTEKMEFLRDAGFFNKDEAVISGNKIRPVDLSAQLLFPQWKLEENEREFTVMTIKISGEEKSVQKEYNYMLFDEYDPETGTSSMARTTGYTCAAAVSLISEGMYTRKGISPPEFLGSEKKCYKKIIDYLSARKIKVDVSSKVKEQKKQ